jgi:hypothetical protein
MTLLQEPLVGYIAWRETGHCGQTDDADVACFKVLSQNSPGKTEDNHEKPQINTVELSTSPAQAYSIAARPKCIGG